MVAVESVNEHGGDHGEDGKWLGRFVIRRQRLERGHGLEESGGRSSEVAAHVRRSETTQWRRRNPLTA